MALPKHKIQTGITEKPLAGAERASDKASILEVLINDNESLESIIRGRFGSGDTDIADIRIDSSTDSLQIVNYEHHEIHGGSHYFVTGYQDLTINQVLQFTWQMPNTTKWIHWTWDIDTESETLWQIYEGGSIVNPLANGITPLNSNRNSANTSGTAMRYEIHANLAGADGDVNVGAALLIASGITGTGKRVSGNATRDNEILLKQNQLYVLRATASAAGYINFNMQWYEHTDRH